MEPESLELLAPAKNLACGIAAIDHGADAVYIGGPKFGARSGAGCSLEDIEKLIKYAHQFRAKVYVAFNTVLSDKELPQAVQLAHQLYDLGADALIIQDVGLLESKLPPIPLHSSTQMNNRTVEKVRFLEEVGFRQVVLARELDLKTIKAIHQATDVPLEFFIHGALCVSYSGQCYISEVVTGRSANRGECSQFCRHKFSLKDEQGKLIEDGKYLLSLKDLDLSGRLSQLIEAGIRSFKIEGRLKDETYVKNVTAHYRTALDTIIKESQGRFRRSSSGKSTVSFVPDPERSFHRGATEYFLNRKKNKVAEIRSPKSTGKFLGKVLQVENRWFLLQSEEEIHNGDGLCYFHPSRGLVGFRVNRVEAGKIYLREPQKLKIGQEIYRNSDPLFNKILVQSEQIRTVDVELTVKEWESGLLLRMRDEDGIETESRVTADKEQARKPGGVIAVAEKQLRKSGGSLFSVKDVTVDLNPSLHFTASLFNQLRRDGFARHVAERFSQYPTEQVEIVPNDYPWPSNEVSYLDNIENRKAENFYLRHGVRKIDRATLGPSTSKHCALMTTRYCLRFELGQCPQQGKDKLALATPLTLVDNTGEYCVTFNCVDCEMVISRQGDKKR